MSVPEGKPVGAVAGRYAIERELGRGGSAIVYLARDLRDANGDGRVALKLLHHEFSGSKAAQRFELEVRLLREFEHPHILPVTDAGEWDGRPFYAMPYVDGESLQGRLKRERRLPFTEVVRIGQRLCEALAYAHERKVVHRDVKPANVMLAGDAVYLTDFGVAKALEPIEGAPHSTTGVARGTRAYMSPEQVVADRDLDHRSDIFSLGCVLYEMIAGVRPFYSADEGRELMRRLVEAPDPLQRHRDGVPEGLESAVMKALAREPADRWNSVKEMGEGLGGTGAGVASASRFRRAWRSAASLAVGAAVTLLLFDSRSNGSAAPDESCALPAIETQSPIRIDVVIGTLESRDANADSIRTILRAPLSGALRGYSDVILSSAETPPDDGQVRCATGKGDVASHVTVNGVRGSGGDSLRISVMAVTARGRREVSTSVRVHDLTSDVIDRLLLSAWSLDGRGVDHVDDGERYSSLRDWYLHQLGLRAIRIGALDSAVHFLNLAAVSPTAPPGVRILSAFVTMLKSPRDVDSWRPPPSLADARADVSPQRQWLLSALSALARGKHTEARESVERAERAESLGYLRSFTMAEIIRLDSTIVPWGTAFRFASNYNEATRLLQETLETCPPRFAEMVMRRLESVAPTSSAVRLGRLSARGEVPMAAYPQFDGDSVSYVPIARARIEGSEPDAIPSSMGRALLHNRTLRLRLAQLWVRRSPESAAAHFALSSAFELLGQLSARAAGDSSAESEIRRAEQLSLEAVAPEDLLVAKVRIAIKAGRFSSARGFIEQGLAQQRHVDPGVRRVLGSLAVMVGAVHAAIPLVEATGVLPAGVTVSDDTRRIQSTLLTLSSLGCCTLAREELTAQLANRYSVEMDGATQRTWAPRALAAVSALGGHCTGWRSQKTLNDTTSLLARLQRDFVNGRHDRVLGRLRTLDRDRGAVALGEVAVEYVVEESLLRLALGDSIAAMASVRRWLTALPTNSALDLTQISQAGGMVRLFALAEDLGRHQSPAGISSSSESPRDLWRNGDAWLKSALQRRDGISMTQGLCDARVPLT